jgi:hypothetical protein
MVEGYIITSKTFLAGIQLKKALDRLPKDLFYFPLEKEEFFSAKVVPITPFVIEAMRKDELIKKNIDNYISTIKPFLRGFIRDINEVEIKII